MPIDREVFTQRVRNAFPVESTFVLGTRFTAEEFFSVFPDIGIDDFDRAIEMCLDTKMILELEDGSFIVTLLGHWANAYGGGSKSLAGWN